MSVSLILVPTALAIAAAVGGTGIAGIAALGRNDAADETVDHGPDSSTASSTRAVEVQTRMKDPTLLASALADLGAIRVEALSGSVTADLEGLSLRMQRSDEGIWAAHLSAADGRDVHEDEATALIARVDAAYARRVQQEVAQRIRDRADAAGFTLVSENRESDDSVTMVLNVQEHTS